MITSVLAHKPLETPSVTILELLSIYAYSSQRRAFQARQTHQVRLNPELRKVLLMLSHPEHLQTLIHQTLAPAVWEAIPPWLRQRLIADFSMLGEIGLSVLRRQYLADVPPEQQAAAKNLLTALELKVVQLSTLFKQDPNLSFYQALHILAVRQPGNPEDEKLISQHWQNSPVWVLPPFQQSKNTYKSSDCGSEA